MRDYKQDFPMLINTPEIAYFDTAATSLTPQVVIDAITNYYTFHNTNINRGVDKHGYKTTVIYESVRTKVGNFLHARYEDEIIFTRGATDSLNAIARMLQHQVTAADEIVLNIAEHHANLIPWIEIAKETGATLRYVDLNEDGSINVAAFADVLNERTKIVAFADVTNVLGSFNNPQVLVPIVREQAPNAYVIVDGAQGVTQYQVDVQANDCDFYVFSGHKLFGPTGVGVLYGKREHLATLQPFEFGGDMVDHVFKESATYKDAPHKFEAGTMMLAEVFGLGAAIDYMLELGYETKHQHIKALRAYAIQELKQIPDVIIYNETNVDAATIAFNIRGVHAHDAASVFSQQDVVVRAGHHCAQLLLEKLDTTSSVRLSFSIHNTRADVDKFIAAAKKAGDFLDVLFG